MHKSFQKVGLFSFGVLFAVGVIFAATSVTNVGDIPKKKGNSTKEESTISHEEFNAIRKSLEGIENENGVFKATTGIVLENRATPPASAEVGRMWFKN